MCNISHDNHERDNTSIALSWEGGQRRRVLPLGRSWPLGICPRLDGDAAVEDGVSYHQRQMIEQSTSECTVSWSSDDDDDDDDDNTQQKRTS